jgi:hypothetical protein
MVGSLLLRGMLVGLIAGLLAFSFAGTFGEPQVERAIAFEERQAQAVSAPSEPELVSRTTQSGSGLLTGTLVYGAAIGGLVALVFAFVQGRVSTLGPRGTSALIALAGFVVIILVPQIKYPANPPAVGHAETIQARTALFFILIALSVGTAIASIGLARRLSVRCGSWNAWIIGSVAYALVMGIANYVLPTVDEVPEAFSATLLWSFRLASFGMQAVVWTTIGLGFGILAERSLLARTGRHASAPAVLR